MAAEAPASAADSAQSHRRASTILIVLATISALLMSLAIWADRQLLETESWTETSSELLEREAIRDAVADYLVAQLFENVDIQGEIASELPPRAALLAGPATGALRQGAVQVTQRALENARIQALWEDANRAAHVVFVEIVEGGGETVSTEGGVVTLDLASILGQVASEVGVPADLTEKLPPDVAQLEILRSDEISAVQDGVSLFKTLAWILVILTLLLFAASVFIAGPRRREALRAVGFSFLFVGVALYLIMGWAGGAIVGSLADTAASQPAVEETFDVATTMLAEIAGAAVVYGIGFVIAAWIAGPTSLATSVRATGAPYLRQPAIAFGGAAVLIALLFWWSPTPGFQRLVPSLLLIALILGGTEMLRRRTIAEFPDRVTPYSAHGIAQVLAERTRAGAGSRVASLRSRRVGTTGEPDRGESPEARIEALERLARLRETGVLSDEELEAEKARILSPPAT
jgi:hypothetical protein